jgi:hypothetical protein
MTSTKIITAQEARSMVPTSRSSLFQEAIQFAISHDGSSNCFVRFRATTEELIKLRLLGYEAYVSNLGATHISWF